MYKAEDRPAQTNLLRRCTYSGRTFEGEQFVATFESQFQRKWRRWSFEKALENRMPA